MIVCRIALIDLVRGFLKSSRNLYDFRTDSNTSCINIGNSELSEKCCVICHTCIFGQSGNSSPCSRADLFNSKDFRGRSVFRICCPSLEHQTRRYSSCTGIIDDLLHFGFSIRIFNDHGIDCRASIHKVNGQSMHFRCHKHVYREVLRLELHSLLAGVCVFDNVRFTCIIDMNDGTLRIGVIPGCVHLDGDGLERLDLLASVDEGDVNRTHLYDRCIQSVCNGVPNICRIHFGEDHLGAFGERALFGVDGDRSAVDEAFHVDPGRIGDLGLFSGVSFLCRFYRFNNFFRWRCKFFRKTVLELFDDGNSRRLFGLD